MKRWVLVGLLVAVLVVSGWPGPAGVRAETWVECQIRQLIESSGKIGGQWHVLVLREFGDSEFISVGVLWVNTTGYVEWRVGEEQENTYDDYYYRFAQVRFEYGGVEWQGWRVKEAGVEPWSWGSWTITGAPGGEWRDCYEIMVKRGHEYYGQYAGRPAGEFIYMGPWDGFRWVDGPADAWISYPEISEDGTSVFSSIPSIVVEFGGYDLNHWWFIINDVPWVFDEETGLIAGDVPASRVAVMDTSAIEWAWANKLKVSVSDSSGRLYSREYRFYVEGGSAQASLPWINYLQQGGFVFSGYYSGVEDGTMFLKTPDGRSIAIPTPGESGQYEVSVYVTQSGSYELWSNGRCLASRYIQVGTSPPSQGEGSGPGEYPVNPDSSFLEMMQDGLATVSVIWQLLPPQIMTLLVAAVGIFIGLRFIGR